MATDNSEVNRLLLERIELAKAWDTDEALRWRGATDEERAQAFSELSAFSEHAGPRVLREERLKYQRLGHAPRKS